MLSRGLRRFHFGRKTPKVSTRDTGVSAELVEATQALRLQLSGDAAAGGRTVVAATPLASLADLAAALGTSPRVPASVFRLVAKALDSSPNFKGTLSAHSLQLLFRAAVQNEAGAELASRLYMELYRHSKLTAQEKLENGRAYYALIRARGFAGEADRMVASLLRDNASAVNDGFVLELLATLAQDAPQSPATPQSTPASSQTQTQQTQTQQPRLLAAPSPRAREDWARELAAGILAIVRACPSVPSAAVLSACISTLTRHRSLDGLEQLADFIYFSNPHFSVAPDVAIMFLDAYIQLPNAGNAAGRKILNACLAGASQQQTPVEVAELLLMAVMHFQEPVALGRAVHELIAARQLDPNSNYTKETWDVLAQWAVYAGGGSLDALRTTVLAQMPAGLCDEQTLRGLLLAASDKAQCSERTIHDLLRLFQDEFGIAPDAAGYEILIQRALKAVEIEHARQLFVESNADWNADGNQHLGALFDLLIALCRTTSVPRQTVIDTYQRVKLFAPRVSYEAQCALLEMFLQINHNDDYTAAGMFLIEQFGERPDLPFESARELFDLFFARIMATRSEQQAWALFGLLNCTIHLPYEAYFPLQNKLCRLGRPDAAHLLFRQLRGRAKQDGARPPGEEIYLMLFRNYAELRYEEGVLELETYFRVDLNNEMTPAMMNHMLGAYVALGDGHKVSNLWAEALALPRGGALGPNSDTMCLMLQFYCTHLGIDAVEDLWTQMPEKFRVAPTQASLKQYVIANCYHGYYMRALEFVKIAPRVYGVEVSADLLRSLYNWTMLPARKQEVQEFAAQAYPAEWAQLTSQPGALKEILLPAEDATGETDEHSIRMAAIKELENEERTDLVAKGRA